MLGGRSEAAWLENIGTYHADKLHLLSQPGPSSGAARLLDSGSLDVLSVADDWEKFRLGLVPLSVVSGGGRVCPLCGLGNHGNVRKSPNHEQEGFGVFPKGNRKATSPK